MTVPVFWVDAFAEQPFAGNPAAVCLLEQPRDESWMSAVAREMNLSETAFVSPREGGFDLRWFTPAVEADLCGHATLASAHVLFAEQRVERGATISFASRSGELLAAGEPGRVELDFPADPLARASLPEEARRALGVDPVATWRGRIGYVVELASAGEVRSVAPDLAVLAGYGRDGFVVTAAGDREGIDFVSRFFVPGAGIGEDPVTGAAHCALGPLWAERLGASEVVGFQASARGGIVGVRPRGERVTLTGGAVTVARGELLA